MSTRVGEKFRINRSNPSYHTGNASVLQCKKVFALALKLAFWWPTCIIIRHSGPFLGCRWACLGEKIACEASIWPLLCVSRPSYRRSSGLLWAGSRKVGCRHKWEAGISGRAILDVGRCRAVSKARLLGAAHRLSKSSLVMLA